MCLPILEKTSKHVSVYASVSGEVFWFFVYAGNDRCECLFVHLLLLSVRISDRRDTCPEPNSLSPYRRLSRTLVPRWVDLRSVLLSRDVASSTDPDKCVLDAFTLVETTALCMPTAVMPML